MEIRFERAERRAAAYNGQEVVGTCVFTEIGGIWIITGTNVEKGYTGQGMAGHLLDAVVEEARIEGIKIVPMCSFAHGCFLESPDYRDVAYDGVIKIYGMPSCPDCSAVIERIEARKEFEFVDIGSHVGRMKTWLRLRDTSPVFDDAKQKGYAGIPCFVFENGDITLDAVAIGLGPPNPNACRIDGSGC